MGCQPSKTPSALRQEVSLQNSILPLLIVGETEACMKLLIKKKTKLEKDI